MTRPGSLIGITGNRAITGFQAPKVLWPRENEPGSYHAAYADAYGTIAPVMHRLAGMSAQ